MAPSAGSDQGTRRAIVRFVCTAAVCGAAWGEVAWLLWSYVPAHAGAFAELAMPLPLATRVTIVMSLWFIRVLPFLVIGAFLAAPLGGGAAALLLIAFMKWEWARTGVTVAVLLMALLAVLISGFAMISIETAY